MRFFDRFKNTSKKETENVVTESLDEKKTMSAAGKRTAKMIAEYYNLPLESVEEKMESVKEKYGLSYYKFAKKDLINCNDIEIERIVAAEAEKQKSRLEEIAGLKKISYEEAAKEFERIRKNFGISFDRYYSKKVFMAENDSEITEMKTRWKDENDHIIKELAEKTGKSVAEVKKLTRKCEIFYNINAEFLLLGKYYEMTEDELERSFGKNTPGEKILKMPLNGMRIAVLLSEHYGIPLEQVKRKMHAAKEKHGLTYFKFAKRNCINADEEMISYFANMTRSNYDSRLNDIGKTLGISFDEAEARFKEVNKKFGIPFERYYSKRVFMADSDEEIRGIIKKWNNNSEKIVSDIAKNSGWTKRQIMLHMRKCDLLYGIDAEHYWILDCWKLEDNQLEQVLTLNMSKLLWRKYNNNKKVGIFIHKDVFDRTFANFIKRKHWVNRDTDFDEFEKFLDGGVKKLFCKPTAMFQGIGAFKTDVPNNHKELYEQLMAREKMIVEECVVQHEKIDEINSSCINTVRVITILQDGKCQIPAACMKIGDGTGVVDNLVNGNGMVVAVDVENGEIVSDGIDLNNNVFKTHPLSGIKFRGFKLPNWNSVLTLAEEASHVVPDVGFIGWDIAITQNGALIIEGNCMPDLGLIQISLAKEGKRIKGIFEKFL